MRIGSFLLSSLVILFLIIPLTARLIKEIPGLECRPIVPTKAQKDVLWAKIWNLFLKRNNRRMKESCHQIMSTKLYTSLLYSIKVWVSSVHLVESLFYKLVWRFKVGQFCQLKLCWNGTNMWTRFLCTRHFQLPIKCDPVVSLRWIWCNRIGQNMAFPVVLGRSFMVNDFIKKNWNWKGMRLLWHLGKFWGYKLLQQE